MPGRMTLGEYREAVEKTKATTWPVIGDVRDIERSLVGGNVFVVIRKRGGFAVVGHWQTTHIETGPFALAREALAEWRRIRGEIEAWRRVRRDAIRREIPVPSGAGSGVGWAAQATAAAICPGCAHRVERRQAKNGRPDPGPPAPASVVVRRRAGLAAPERAG